jgi:hypothetical protein
MLLPKIRTIFASVTLLYFIVRLFTKGEAHFTEADHDPRQKSSGAVNPILPLAPLRRAVTDKVRCSRLLFVHVHLGCETLLVQVAVLPKIHLDRGRLPENWKASVAALHPCRLEEPAE